MKKITFLLFLLGITFLSHATIIRCNNNSAVIGTYATAQAAHNAANAGDTIHLETSVTSYGALTATKSLVWIGNGFFQDPSKASYMDAINCNAGSANSLFMGIYCNEFNVQTQSISINRCCLFSLQLTNSSNNLCGNFSLSQSFVRSIVTYWSSSTPASGFTFTNNVFIGQFNLTNMFTNIVYSHNYFHSFANGLAVAANNNIFNSISFTVGMYSTTVYNNLFVGASSNLNYVGANGNIYANTTMNSSTNTIFSGSVAGSHDAWVNLKANSPALNAGLGGTHIGPNGGSNFYRTGGIPPIPSFTQFQVQSAPVNILPVVISTKSNN